MLKFKKKKKIRRQKVNAADSLMIRILKKKQVRKRCIFFQDLSPTPLQAHALRGTSTAQDRASAMLLAMTAGN